MQKIIIDGYNVLHQIQPYKTKLTQELESARIQLVHDLKIYKSTKKIEILVVFDGSAEIPTPTHHKFEGGIEIIFSRAPLKADPVIMKIIKLEKQKGRISVVTSDREILDYAKLAGSKSMSPHEFYNRIKTPLKELEFQHKFDHDMTAEELEEWKIIFGVED